MGLLSRAAPRGASVDHIESSMCLPARVVLNTTTGRAANPSGSGWEQPREPVRSSDTLPASEEVARRRLRRTGATATSRRSGYQTARIRLTKRIHGTPDGVGERRSPRTRRVAGLPVVAFKTHAMGRPMLGGCDGRTGDEQRRAPRHLNHRLREYTHCNTTSTSTATA